MDRLIFGVFLTFDRRQVQQEDEAAPRDNTHHFLLSRIVRDIGKARTI